MKTNKEWKIPFSAEELTYTNLSKQSKETLIILLLDIQSTLLELDDNHDELIKLRRKFMLMEKIFKEG